ncbi:MAG TPA: sulfotransferase domain-containing protein, partial [Thermomicrobiales bacterium]|nr:sulfotransferase domain-containing protein [Thermomicrobiales bacterium]
MAQFHGSQLKLWNYFTHVLAAPEFTPRISFGSQTIWNETNPWLKAKDYIVDDPYSLPADVFFLGGRQWTYAEKHPDWGPQTPVINLVQHVNHADEGDDRREHLSRPAIRICVSPEVSAALEATGTVRGPLIVIPNGIDFDDVIAQPSDQNAVDILIAALKRPDIGAELERRLTRPGRRVRLLTERLPRAEYLSHVHAATVTVFLPNDTEGFYLPVLEGFAADTLVVCPDCIGNRTFCLPGYNAFRPSFKLHELAESAEAALSLSPERADRMRANARATAEQYTLHREREAFHGVLRDIDELWQEALAATRVEPGRTAMPSSGVEIERPVRQRRHAKVKRKQRRAGQPPDYIIVGTQKGGTTSLHRYLTAHPQVKGSRGKELHFFSWKYDRGLDWYFERFPPEGKAKVVGEASTSYLCHPEAPARVRRELPDVKSIVLLRNP